MRGPYTPHFESWSRENLDRFAHECYAHLRTQHNQIQNMQQRVKTLEQENKRLLAQIIDDWK